ncbi:expressed protein [Phakopsora pachyrhizi]|uniref:Expressed protein n=1 Tax=Phakopsora pachyrhizi TaxID=170000 RepID=A0AAV0AG57_PHAPC|nr:expressed protein [Phakopsora pachyrhizi]
MERKLKNQRICLMVDSHQRLGLTRSARHRWLPRLIDCLSLLLLATITIPALVSPCDASSPHNRLPRSNPSINHLPKRSDQQFPIFRSPQKRSLNSISQILNPTDSENHNYTKVAPHLEKNTTTDSLISTEQNHSASQPEKTDPDGLLVLKSDPKNKSDESLLKELSNLNPEEDEKIAQDPLPQTHTFPAANQSLNGGAGHDQPSTQVSQPNLSGFPPSSSLPVVENTPHNHSEPLYPPITAHPSLQTSHPGSKDALPSQGTTPGTSQPIKLNQSATTVNIDSLPKLGSNTTTQWLPTTSFTLPVGNNGGKNESDKATNKPIVNITGGSTTTQLPSNSSNSKDTPDAALLNPNSTIGRSVFQFPSTVEKNKDKLDTALLNTNSTFGGSVFQFPSAVEKNKDKLDTALHNPNSTFGGPVFQFPSAVEKKNKPDATFFNSNNSIGGSPFHFPPNIKNETYKIFHRPSTNVLDINNTVGSSTFQLTPGNDKNRINQKPDTFDLTPNNSITTGSFRFPATNKSLSDLPFSGTTWRSSNISSLFFPSKKTSSVNVSAVESSSISPAFFNTSGNTVTLPFKTNSTNGKQSDSDSSLSQIISSNPSLFNASLIGGSLSSPLLNKTAISEPFKIPTDNPASSSLLNTSSSLSANFSDGRVEGTPFQIHINKSAPSLTDPSFNSSSGQLLGGSYVNETFAFPVPGRTNGSALTETEGNVNSTRSISQAPSSTPAFVPSGSLFTNPTTQRTNITVPSQRQPNPSNNNIPKNDAPPVFPSTLPRYIVPTGAPSSAPVNTTLISILFTDELNWPWLVTNSNASSQVLVFMPALISSSLGIPNEQVTTQSLQAYQPADYDSKNEAGMLALWLGYIPSQYVDALQAMIKSPQSQFYHNPDPLLNALAKTVDPSFPITSFTHKAPVSKVTTAGADEAQGDTTPVDKGQKIAVIASVTTCGAAILAIGIIFAARRSKRKLLSRQGSSSRLEEGGPLTIGAPMINEIHRISSRLVNSREPQDRSGWMSAGYLPGPYGGESQNYHPVNGDVEDLGQVRYEYGQARTTSMVGGEAQRTSWWWRLSGTGGAGAPSRGVEEVEGGSTGLERSRSAESAGGSGDGGHGYRAGQGHRRLQITRGADGLVSGIGRPVMKENSLFF